MFTFLKTKVKTTSVERFYTTDSDENGESQKFAENIV